MKMAFFKISILLVLISSFSLVNSEAKEFKNYKEFYDALENLQVDTEHAYKVSDIVMMQDAGTTVLDSGVIYFMQDIGDGKHIAIFSGAGSFEVMPSIKVERINAIRTFNKEYYSTTFEDACFVFDDDFFESVSSSSIKTSVPDPDDVQSLYTDAWKSFTMPTYEHVYDGLVHAILEKGNSDFSFSEFLVGVTDHYAWVINPMDKEECSLYMVNDGVGNSEHDMKLIFTFDKQEDLQLSELERSKSKQKFIVNDIDVDIDFYRDKNFYSTATLKLQALEDFQWASFSTNDEYDVLSVKDGNGKDIGFYHQKPTISDKVWINFPEKLKAGETASLTFRQKCNLFGVDAIRRSNLYPVDNNFYDKKKFHLKVKSTTNKELFAFGNKVFEEEDGNGSVITKWEYPDSLYQIGIILNNYRETEIDPGYGPKEVTFKYNSVANLDMLEDNYILAYRYLSSIFGPLPDQELFIYELPEEINRSVTIFERYTGFDFQSSVSAYSYFCNRTLALGPVYFQVGGMNTVRSYVGMLSTFWFGNGFEPVSNRDSWLYGALYKFIVNVYAQIFFEDKTYYPKTLDAYHKAFITLDNANKDFSDYGCLSLGSYGNEKYRADGSAMNLKSFFIIHMLRNMLIDYANRMSEQRFMSVINEFYQTYKNQKYSVNGFRTILEKYYGNSLQWFFDQWVDGTAIPTYKFASKTVENENGQYIVQCQVRQENVPDEFVMPVPIRIEFDDDEYLMTRAVVQGKQVKFDLGPFDEEPEDIIFNPNYSVLSDTQSKSWEDDF